MVVSMLDQMMFRLACGDEVLLGRMTNLDRWVCESCGEETDLTAEPFRSTLVRELNTAVQIELEEKAKGETITRLA